MWATTCVHCGESCYPDFVEKEIAQPTFIACGDEGMMPFAGNCHALYFPGSYDSKWQRNICANEKRWDRERDCENAQQPTRRYPDERARDTDLIERWTPMQQKQRFEQIVREGGYYGGRDNSGADTSRTAYVRCIHYQCACCGDHVEEGTFSYLSWTPPDFSLYTPPHWDNLEPEIWPQPMRGHRRQCKRCADGIGALTGYPNRCPWAVSSIADPDELARLGRYKEPVATASSWASGDGPKYWQCVCRGRKFERALGEGPMCDWERCGHVVNHYGCQPYKL